MINVRRLLYSELEDVTFKKLDKVFLLNVNRAATHSMRVNAVMEVREVDHRNHVKLLTVDGKYCYTDVSNIQRINTEFPGPIEEEFRQVKRKIISELSGSSRESALLEFANEL